MAIQPACRGYKELLVDEPQPAELALEAFGGSVVPGESVATDSPPDGRSQLHRGTVTVVIVQMDDDL